MFLSIGSSAYFYTKYKSSESKRAKETKTVNMATKIVTRYTDRFNQNHVVIDAKETELSRKQFNDIAVSPGILDTTVMALNIQKRQIESLTQIATTTEARALKAERRVDSLKRLTYYYKDKYLDLAFSPSETKDTMDFGTFDFKYNADLTITQYNKRKWLLGTKKTFIDIYSNDPRTTVNGVKRLAVQQERPTLGLRVQAVSSYNFESHNLMNGVGLQVDVKRMSFLGAGYYDFRSNKWVPAITARYDILRF